MTHLEAQNRIKGCHDHLILSVSRYAQGRLGQDDAGESGEARFWVANILGELGLTQPLCFSSWHPTPMEQHFHRGLTGTVWRCRWLKRGRSTHLTYGWNYVGGLTAGGRQPKIRAERRP